MSCAGCDHCPEGHWHLHVTVASSEILTPADEEHFLSKYEIKFVRVENVMSSGSYRELIPTMHVKGSENVAILGLMNMYHMLLSHGFRVTRLKIEGDARMVPTGRALYYETHVTIPEGQPEMVARAAGMAVSRTATRTIVTIRERTVNNIHLRLGTWEAVMIREHAPSPLRVEACVLDTAPELDDAWISPRG